MKPWVKILISGLVGFGGGFAAGFFLHKKLNDVQIEEISEEEFEEIEKSFAEAKGTDEKKHHDILDEVKSVQDLPEDPDKLRLALQRKTPYIQADQDQKTAYEKLWNATKEYSDEENANDIPVPAPYDDEEEFDEDFLEQIELEAQEAGNAFVEPPHIISLAEFYNERPDFDKVTIDWYEEGDTWIDEKGEIIADPTSYIGMLDIRKTFAENTYKEDPDVRYVRNDAYGSDYEIIRHHRSYLEDVGGVE